LTRKNLEAEPEEEIDVDEKASYILQSDVEIASKEIMIYLKLYSTCCKKIVIGY